MDDKVSLFGPLSVIGRAFVVRSKQVQLDVPALGLGRLIVRDANHAGSCGKGALNHSLLTLRVPKLFYLTSETKYNYWVQVFFRLKGFYYFIDSSKER